MRVGAHVRAGKGLVPALAHGAEIGARVVQFFTQSPRMWKPSQYGPDVLEAFRQAAAAHRTISATFCHATYLINIATADEVIRDRSRECLNANLMTAQGMGADGLVLHIGSHRGEGFDPAVPRIVEALEEALDAADSVRDAMGSSGPGRAPCPILLENAAGAGDTVGRSFDELAAVIDAAGGDERLGVCLDTQHLWASGVPFTTRDEADAVVDEVRSTVGLERLRCLHVNDSKVEFGANRDRHENLGKGTIGAEGFRALLSHPALDGLPAVLEVPGAGDGPRRRDLTTARRFIREGVAARG